MKNLAFLLIAVCLTLGVIAATTAYVPRLSLPDEQLLGLTINAAAGMEDRDDGRRVAIITDETKITPEVLATLREAGVQRVRVKEFSFARWSHWWLMLIAVGGLTVGAVVVRTSTRREIETAMAEDGEKDSLNPVAMMEMIRETIHSLDASLPTMADDESRNAAIVEQFGEVQATMVPAFVEARPRLIAKLGLGGFAELMDRFAAMERQVNRAWSAAADGVTEEALICVRAAAPLADEAAAKLGT
ncbi:MAG: hypothetical protein EA379_12335 [Phycisphaerales bacterium]|nr:MAG: hypothetical protein EA379_12335 [Phycisphaerales bacterium]